MNCNASRGRVMLVDDEPAVCLLLSEGLGREGFECKTATSGEEALRLLPLEPFDVVISDLRMPGLSGLALLEAVRTKFPRLSFLIATGVNNVRVGVAAMKQGAADYLVKPFQIEAVVASLERAMEKKRMELQLENYRQHLEQMVEQRTKQLQTAIKRIEMTYDQTLEALGAALDLRDTDTEGHSRRVSRYCLEIARAMGCSGEQLKNIARGSYLHDIGKIGIPDSILLKPGKVTEAETVVMQTHARIGFDLVSRVAFLAPAAEMVLTHQEHYDGTGYPLGLAGNEIPLGARIFAVADTLDAMTSNLPYRRALGFGTARDEIVRQSGLQFDPEVVAAFLSVPEQVWQNVRLEVARQQTSGHPLFWSETKGSAPLNRRPQDVVN